MHRKWAVADGRAARPRGDCLTSARPRSARAPHTVPAGVVCRSPILESPPPLPLLRLLAPCEPSRTYDVFPTAERGKRRTDASAIPRLIPDPMASAGGRALRRLRRKTPRGLLRVVDLLERVLAKHLTRTTVRRDEQHKWWHHPGRTLIIVWWWGDEQHSGGGRVTNV